MTLSLQTVSEMKKQLAEKFGVNLHFCDSCGGQSFRFDSPPDSSVVEWVNEYTAGLGAKANFFTDGTGFTLTKK
jgi:hypothetical protein